MIRRSTLFTILITALLTAGITYFILNPNPGITTTPKNDSVCMNYDNENMSTLDVDLVHTMVDTYKTNQLDFINTNSGSKTTNDAHSIWFDLETLKKFVYHIETISKKTETTITNDKLGIRIYYAAYPEKKTWENKFEDLRDFTTDPEKAQYGSLHTLVMVPTIEIGDGKMADFNPLDKNTYSNGLAGLKEYNYNDGSPIPNSNPTAALTSSTRNSGARNHGILIPPATAPSQIEGFYP